MDQDGNASEKPVELHSESTNMDDEDGETGAQSIATFKKNIYTIYRCIPLKMKVFMIYFCGFSDSMEELNETDAFYSISVKDGDENERSCKGYLEKDDTWTTGAYIA
jgi:hypothetical protein